MLLGQTGKENGQAKTARLGGSFLADDDSFGGNTLALGQREGQRKLCHHRNVFADHTEHAPPTDIDALRLKLKPLVADLKRQPLFHTNGAAPL